MIIKIIIIELPEIQSIGFAGVPKYQALNNVLFCCVLNLIVF